MAEVTTLGTLLEVTGPDLLQTSGLEIEEEQKLTAGSLEPLNMDT